VKKLVSKNLPAWAPVLAAMVVPGSGYVLLGKPFRALQMLFFMGFMAFITFNLSAADVSLVGRLAGGFAVWVLSIVEISGAVKRRGLQDKASSGC
jgi:hypothetical protein